LAEKNLAVFLTAEPDIARFRAHEMAGDRPRNLAHQVCREQKRILEHDDHVNRPPGVVFRDGSAQLTHPRGKTLSSKRDLHRPLKTALPRSPRPLAYHSWHKTRPKEAVPGPTPLARHFPALAIRPDRDSGLVQPGIALSISSTAVAPAADRRPPDANSARSKASAVIARREPRYPFYCRAVSQTRQSLSGRSACLVLERIRSRCPASASSLHIDTHSVQLQFRDARAAGCERSSVKKPVRQNFAPPKSRRGARRAARSSTRTPAPRSAPRASNRVPPGCPGARDRSAGPAAPSTPAAVCFRRLAQGRRD